ncbi:MAG: 16S rRNA (guanine(527)-N(7))-methyltransferase RsmG [Phycisphaeraceae bacterium]|nr:16S rRNA (guanine(527)-N(7))-methyltransferase RsmG [Phycisphaerales bacterium]MCB9842454.1 16S rRNA (guanine(527)-N(7))-methyltransferase RsmG [Phycisphaeraceae bacterium]
MKPDRPPIEFASDAPPLTPTREFLGACAGYGIEFDGGDTERLGRFLALMLDANDRCNLTSITEPGQAWMKHIFDALTLIPLLGEIDEGGLVADIGSGGGVPAIPLAICLPHLRFTLFESTAKKVAFLESVIRALKLTNASVVNRRAEDAGQDHKNYRERFDAVTARALGRIVVAAELTVPLAKVGGADGGRVLLVKGERAEEELAEAKQALHLLHATHAGTIQTPTGRIVVLEHARKTPRDYPRRDGEPKRRPLGTQS